MKTLTIDKNGTLKLTPSVRALLGNAAEVSIREMAGGFFISPVPRRKVIAASDRAQCDWQAAFGTVALSDAKAVESIVESEFETVDPDDWK